MRKLLSICATVLLLGVPAAAFAQFLVVTYDQVSMSQEGMFVEVRGDLIAVTELTVANDGHFVAKIKKLHVGQICPVCRCTENYGDRCVQCGHVFSPPQGEI